MNGTILSHYMDALSVKKENIVLQWAFKLNSAPAPAETWDLKGHMLEVKL
jgi:hypothetical protein